MRTALFALFVLLSCAPSATDDGRDWGFSAVATGVCSDGHTDTTVRIPAPDGLKKLVVIVHPGEEPKFYLTVGESTFPVEYFGWPCPEILWAPDSQALFINYSEGGAVGNFHVMVYRLGSSGLTATDPTQSVKSDFLAHYPPCFFPEEPNLAGIAWVRDSNRLLVAAEVLPHSNCDKMGTFSAYAIDTTTGNIIARYQQLDAKRRFSHLLGPELRGANDECFRKPGSCEIPALHKGQK